jgi:poly(A) polymerase Pap1
VHEWMVRLCAALSKTQAGLLDPAFARAHILPFGSFRLGVNAVDADIDTVLLVPRHVKRGRDFFGSVDVRQGVPWMNEPQNILCNVLKADPRVSKFVPVEDTHTPIITFLFTPSGGSGAPRASNSAPMPYTDVAAMACHQVTQSRSIWPALR